jgi:hypothetical protein
MAVAAGGARQVSGWFALKRGMHDHPLFHKQPLRVAAWSWIIATAAYSDTRQDAGGKMVTVKRGQLLTSYRQMSDRTGVPIKTLRLLIGRLQAEDAIGTDTGTGRLLITIRNYDKYQEGGTSKGTGKGTQRAQQGHTKETNEQVTTLEDKSSNGADAPIDPVKVMFDSGRKMLTASGRSAVAAGRMLGKWRAEHGTEAVIAALGRAQREGAIDPTAFVESCLRDKASKPRDRPQPGDMRTTADGREMELNPMGEWIEVRR